MSSFQHFAQAYRRQVWRTVPTTVLTPVALAGLAAITLTGCSTDHFVDLNTLYVESEPWELATNARDTTDVLCAAAMPACVQALSTDQAHYLKYDSVQEAEDAMSVAGVAEVARAGAIVVEFTKVGSGAGMPRLQPWGGIGPSRRRRAQVFRWFSMYCLTISRGAPPTVATK